MTMRIDFYGDWREPDDFEEDSCWELVDRKSVPDSDGFYTDYCLYYNVCDDYYVTVFGDRDLYGPEQGYFDAEFDNETEALEWFNNYTGFEDDLDSNDVIDESNPDSGKYVVYGYYSSNFSGVEDSFQSNDWSEVTEIAHDMLSRGDYVEITNLETGKTKLLSPDEYFDMFNGEFPITSFDLD